MDANILIRAVAGTRVRQLLIQYSDGVQFYAPQSAFDEAGEHLPRILSRRAVQVSEGMKVLHAISKVVQSIPLETLSGFEHIARERMRQRDEEDWPVLAAAMALNCGIWTEDQDFFGSGVATWTTDRVEIFLRDCARNQDIASDQ